MRKEINGVNDKFREDDAFTHLESEIKTGPLDGRFSVACVTLRVGNWAKLEGS